MAALGLSTRALNALERVNVVAVRALLRTPIAHVSHMRGVGNKTRRELVDVVRQLAARFPDVEPEPPPTVSGEPAVTSLDLIVRQLVPDRQARDRSSIASAGDEAQDDAREPRVLRRLLGLEDLPRPAAMGWPSQTVVAGAEGITRARVGQIAGKARERWSRNRSVGAVRDDVAALLEREGGVMTAVELREALLLLRGSTREGAQRARVGTGAVRAACEVERSLASARWVVRRAGDVVLVARSEALADWAERLGREADRLAATDPLPSPARVVEALQATAPPPGVAPVAPTRLVRLAAAASDTAAVSSRLELYPRGMSAERAIKLAHGALLVPELTEQQIRERVIVRYPEAGGLPRRPELDGLLATTGLPFAWVAEAGVGRGAYVLRRPEPLSSSGTPPIERLPTVHHPPLDASPEVAACRQLEERLQRSAGAGGFLVLTAETRRLRDAERELARRFAVEVRSLEAELIRRMREEAARSNVTWDVVLRADAVPADAMDLRLLVLVDRALGALESALPTDATLLLTNSGLLGRYDRIGFFQRLRDRIDLRGDPTRPRLHGVWVLVPTDDPAALPAIDGRAIPVIGPGEWAHVTEAWLENRHRGAKNGVPAGASA